jgi:hypothetical protein
MEYIHYMWEMEEYSLLPYIAQQFSLEEYVHYMWERE